MPGGSHSVTWYQYYRNALSLGNDHYAINARIGGASGGNCGSNGPIPAEFWGAIGTVTRNGIELGSLWSGNLSGAHVPDAILSLDELGSLTFRRAGLLPTAVYISSPFSY
ncbi:MAG: hypothetical protein SGI90_05880 [Candidatus Eisenbacteria bacterium]|nr:hypothetical protein [Candidatus Eisenbacteria bacterium]